MFGLRQSIDECEKHSPGAGIKYLIDAQMPYLLADLLRHKGFEVLHTDDLPDKDETSDSTIRKIAAKENYVVITKDSDFQDSYLLFKQPPLLLLITTGNIKTENCLTCFGKQFP